MSDLLTTDWLQKHATRLHHEFNLNGYVSIPGFFNADELADIKANKKRFVQDVIPTMPESEVYYEDANDKSTLKQLQNMWQHDAFFGNMMAEKSKLTTLSEICLNEGTVPKNMQYFNKHAGGGQPTPPHQDGYFFHLVPNNAITIWYALEDVEPEQGCVNYVQGSHKYGMRAHGASGVLGFSQSILDFGIPHDHDNAVAFPCKAGHLIAHHSLTIHWAEGNRSADKSRQAMGAIYYGESATEDAAAKNAYQERLNAQLAAAGKI
ncbi:MAG: phytanoyl-CoA dioxygenase family protein [Akkermansiaceae bacterium]